MPSHLRSFLLHAPYGILSGLPDIKLLGVLAPKTQAFLPCLGKATFTTFRVPAEDQARSVLIHSEPHTELSAEQKSPQDTVGKTKDTK